jgi:hypothetical protein
MSAEVKRKKTIATYLKDNELHAAGSLIMVRANATVNLI